MPAKLQPARFAITSRCTRLCSFNAANLPAGAGQVIHSWYEEGLNDRAIVARAAEIGIKLSTTPAWRHRTKHLEKVEGTIPTAPDPGKAAPKLSDLEILEKLIARGAETISLSSTKVSAEMLMKALELKHKMTQGSVFDQLLGSLAEDDPDDLPVEAPELVASTDERTQVADPDRG